MWKWWNFGCHHLLIWCYSYHSTIFSEISFGGKYGQLFLKTFNLLEVYSFSVWLIWLYEPTCEDRSSMIILRLTWASFLPCVKFYEVFPLVSSLYGFLIEEDDHLPIPFFILSSNIKWSMLLYNFKYENDKNDSPGTLCPGNMSSTFKTWFLQTTYFS